MPAPNSLPPVGETRARLRFVFATPWWRLVWFCGAIVWCVTLNAFSIVLAAQGTWLGPASALPLLAFAIDALARTARPGDDGQR